MKLLKICFLVFIAAMAFSACERQGEVINIVKGTPTNSDSVLPRKFKADQKTDSLMNVHEKEVPSVFRR